MELKRSGQGSLNGGETNLAIALECMTVARGKQRTGHEYGEVDRAPNAELLVVHVAAEGPWLLGGEPSPTRRRRYAEIAEEGAERQFLPPRQSGNVALAIERNVEAAEFRKVFWQGAEHRHL